MTTYIATIRTAFTEATDEIEADTPEQALQKTRHLWDTNPCWFDWQTREPLAPLPDEIEIEAPSGEGAFWRNEILTVRLAAYDMLEALEQAVEALNTAPRFKVTGLGCDSYKVAAICDAALKKARG